MTSSSFAVVVLFLAATASLAREPVQSTALNAVQVHDHAIVLDCRDLSEPSMSAVAVVLGTINAAHIVGERERLMHTARRYCMRGAPSVAFVRDSTTQPSVLALAH